MLLSMPFVAFVTATAVDTATVTVTVMIYATNLDTIHNQCLKSQSDMNESLHEHRHAVEPEWCTSCKR